MKYCPLCRSDLSRRDIDGQTRLACSAAECGFVHWNNPIPVVAGLVQLSDSYVLVRNAGWPASVFSLLTGFLENGESPTSAVVREAHDRATGKLVLGDEIAEVKLVSPTELASFDFGPLRLSCEIVSCWLKDGCGASAEQTVAPDRDTSVVDALRARLQPTRPLTKVFG